MYFMYTLMQTAVLLPSLSMMFVSLKDKSSVFYFFPANFKYFYFLTYLKIAKEQMLNNIKMLMFL